MVVGLFTRAIHTRVIHSLDGEKWHKEDVEEKKEMQNFNTPLFGPPYATSQQQVFTRMHDKERDKLNI